MALNTAEILRFRMADRPRQLMETRYGDGTATAFPISGYPLVSGSTALGGFTPSAFVPIGAGGTAWSATGATWNYPLGTISFSSILSAQSAFMLSYTYAVFSDQEIDYVTANFAGIGAMQLTLIDNLMGDAYKRERWGSQAGSFYDSTETMKNLMLMRSAIRTEMTVEAGPQGAFVSWDAEQENRG